MGRHTETHWTTGTKTTNQLCPAHTARRDSGLWRAEDSRPEKAPHLLEHLSASKAKTSPADRAWPGETSLPRTSSRPREMPELHRHTVPPLRPFEADVGITLQVEGQQLIVRWPQPRAELVAQRIIGQTNLDIAKRRQPPRPRTLTRHELAVRQEAQLGIFFSPASR